MLKNSQNDDQNGGKGAGYFELIDFTLVRHLADGREVRGTYGVNVVKVREVIHLPPINPLASSVPGIEGIFELRGVPIPAVNLCTILGDAKAPLSPEDQIIVTEFGHKRAGFIVHQTNRIRRVTWDKILPPSSDKASSMTGMMLIEGNEFLFILDLERIVANLEALASGRPLVAQETSSQQVHTSPRRSGFPTILLVDDSSLILNSIGRTLNVEGYGVVLARNGIEALQRLEESETGAFPIDGVITDLEMPQMDGISLLKRLRATPRLNAMPIYLHSSLSDPGSREAALKMGATSFFVKNDTSIILQTLRERFAVGRRSA